MDDLLPQFRSDPLVEEVSKKVKIGTIVGLIGVLFFGIVLGPIAVYYGAGARNGARSLEWRSKQKAANFVIALGVFDILFSLVMIVGTIRTIGAGG